VIEFDDFPLCAEGKTGWPWFGPVDDEPIPSNQQWPKISVITPNYNYGNYLEETIRSVLLQGYPNLEYIVMDGASSDNSLEVIKKYAPWLSYWESEKDRGQAHAINKGFARATGDLIIWINSDDLLLPGALRKFAENYDASNETMIFTDVINFSPDRNDVYAKQSGIVLENFIGIPEEGFSWHQPGIAVPRSFYEKVGGLDESLHYIFDWDWICRLLIHCSDISYVHAPVARFRVHDMSKTGSGMLECWQEAVGMLGRYKEFLLEKNFRKVIAFYHMKMAMLYFSGHAGAVQYWSRRKGMQSLLQALWYDFRLIHDGQFIHLFIRALLPRSMYRSK